ncbi:hypothetical protein BP6252_08103 [Coleophoma cylindrospora]|uniref:Uncharacterized protein n=1 Tax=Coleophoma cylindrospora TaxID=1849047 RepID=A0A3D8RC32_9HELO|nr:hypothetical protein BP6252_08103 [Coleophoma cylindrospora]
MATRTPGSVLFRSLKALQVYGANTDVGKTVVSTILCKALARATPEQQAWYLKPVSTGPLEDADDYSVSRFSPETRTKCLFQYDLPVSPHIAARGSKLPAFNDNSILSQVYSHITECHKAGPGTLLLETAGGIHSPTPASNSQADLYRPLRLPVLLVADARLGGISSSISAFESLHIRGYDIDSILVWENRQYQNHAYLHDYFKPRNIPVLALPPPPPRDNDRARDHEQMSLYYEKVSTLEKIDAFVENLSKNHEARIEKLTSLSTRAESHIWYPFTQHKDLSAKDIMTIDSAYGDFFQAVGQSNAEVPNSEAPNLLEPTVDGSASWWTQGLGHGDPQLSLAAAYAAGRYGHVMFAGAIHEPAMSLSELMLQNMHNPRLQRVFFSDNGSTGMEVATKMGLTAASQRYQHAKHDIGVIGLKGSYHGDTIGAMDCSEPSTFNGKVHWYEGRGYWFDFPQVKLKAGNWIVEPPSGMENGFGPATEFASLNDIFDMGTRDQSLAASNYRSYITEVLGRLQNEGKRFGALIMEPILLGAGGMLFVDPLFQRCLVQVVRQNPQLFTDSSSPSTETASPPSSQDLGWSGLPVIFDEVFTGLYRLGRFNSASFLGVDPDISVHAKLLTGGLLPLCVTLASDSVYEAFLGTEKSDALLHGHSYTAHAVGCEVARTSVQKMMEMEKTQEWSVFQNDWSSSQSNTIDQESSQVWSMWSQGFLHQASLSPSVESVVALGSVLAINLQDDISGYNSTAARGLQGRLRADFKDFSIHSRVLGNVFYLMMSQTTKMEAVRRIEQMVLASLTGSS